MEKGTRLNHYEIVGRAGSGGMGEVYVATDTKLDRRVALKLLPEDVAQDPERRERFTREAKAVAALNHPNIVTMHSVEEATLDGDHTVHFLTMELVEGQKELPPIEQKPEAVPRDVGHLRRRSGCSRHLGSHPLALV